MWIKESRFQLKLVNQIFLFCNVYTSLAWFVSSCFVLYLKAPQCEDLSLNFPLICFCIGFPVESLRLYFGYSGNLRNNVLDIAGFLILTTFIEFPIHIYLLLSLHHSFHHISLILQSVQLTLLPIEIFLNFIIMRGSLHERNLQFQMMYNSDQKLQ